MDIGKGFSKVVQNEQVQGAVKKFGKEVVIASAVGLATGVMKDGADSISQSAKNSLKQDKEFKDKYNRLDKLPIDPKTDFKDYINAVEEANNMCLYYRYKKNELNMMNPISLSKMPSFHSKYEKWKSLRANLTSSASNKMDKECKLTFETKIESSFFSKYPEINSELLACKTLKEASTLQTRYFLRYINVSLSDL